MQHRLDIVRIDAVAGQGFLEQVTGLQNAEAVSYTHLTLPTSDLV